MCHLDLVLKQQCVSLIWNEILMVHVSELLMISSQRHDGQVKNSFHDILHVATMDPGPT